ncbi:MAG: DNA repair exonuclease [Thermomicrobiales bacterium]
MADESIKVLCTGDLHIGRRSSRLPGHQDGSEHSCSGAWDAIVDSAITERVDIVALSGDLVDRENRYFEAIGPLERGLRRLAEAGIESYAVSGNHDFDVLPQLADTLDIEGFYLLGRGGEWERRTVHRGGQAALHIDGWSFPRQDVSNCALDSYQPDVDGTPVLGLIHADLDQPASRYGPVTIADLHRRPVALWLLGHIHAGAILAEPGRPIVMYPGSPQAMDPGEQGLHGIVIADIRRSGEVRTREIAISTVRYLPLTIDVSGIESEDEIRSKIYGELRDALADDEHRYDRLTCLSCRLTITGRTPLHGRIREITGSIIEDLNLTGPTGTEAIVERIDIDTRLAIDLETVARRNDPPGEIAKFIKAVEAGDAKSSYRDLVSSTVRQLREIHRANTFSGIALDEPPGEAAALRHLQSEAWSLLDALISQKEAV